MLCNADFWPQVFEPLDVKRIQQILQLPMSRCVMVCRSSRRSASYGGMQAHKLQLHSFLRLALMQVLMTRHTVMVVGQTGGGKSVILQTLARAQTKMGKRTSMSILNPKVTAVL